MKRCLAFAAVCLFLTSGVILAQERNDPPRRPPQTTPGQPPMPGGPGGFPQFPMGGAPGGFPMPGGADHKELVSALVDILEDNDTDVRASAAQALAKIGRQSVEPLISILKDKDKSAGLRANAAYILGQIGPQAREALTPLTKALKENDKELRKRAAFAIANIVEETGGFNFPPGGFPGGGFGGGVGVGRPGQGKIPDPGVVGPSNVKEKKPSDEKKPE